MMEWRYLDRISGYRQVTAVTEAEHVLKKIC